MALCVATVVAGACAAQAPSGPCLADLPEIVTIPFSRLEQVSHEADGTTELVRFQFDPASAGVSSATVAPADAGPFIEANIQEQVAVQGARLTAVRIEGLVGGAATDRLRVGPEEPYRIREVVQVSDPNAFRWIVGTTAGACLRLRSDDRAATISLIVTDR